MKPKSVLVHEYFFAGYPNCKGIPYTVSVVKTSSVYTEEDCKELPKNTAEISVDFGNGRIENYVFPSSLEDIKRIKLGIDERVACSIHDDKYAG